MIAWAWCVDERESIGCARRAIGIRRTFFTTRFSGGANRIHACPARGVANLQARTRFERPSFSIGRAYRTSGGSWTSFATGGAWFASRIHAFARPGGNVARCPRRTHLRKPAATVGPAYLHTPVMLRRASLASRCTSLAGNRRGHIHRVWIRRRASEKGDAQAEPQTSRQASAMTRIHFHNEPRPHAPWRGDKNKMSGA